MSVQGCMIKTFGAHCWPDFCNSLSLSSEVCIWGKQKRVFINLNWFSAEIYDLTYCCVAGYLYQGWKTLSGGTSEHNGRCLMMKHIGTLVYRFYLFIYFFFRWPTGTSEVQAMPVCKAQTNEPQYVGIIHPITVTWMDVITEWLMLDRITSWRDVWTSDYNTWPKYKSNVFLLTIKYLS